MILQLASRHCNKIAAFFVVVFYLSIVLPANAAMRAPAHRVKYSGAGNGFSTRNTSSHTFSNKKKVHDEIPQRKEPQKEAPLHHKTAHHEFIGGPGQPEMSSFKSVSSDKLVNLFTGDFSYNIPLLDVGGYPINIYYDGGVTPEQDASWVGLGWNLNPGNINRNMRGIPDDFNGDEKLIQETKIKPNRTWGISMGADAEMLGIKLPVDVELGVSFNNYLGPSLSAGIRGGISLFNITAFGGSEKVSASLGATANYGIDINSRAGTSFTGGVSLNAKGNYNYNHLTAGIGASTGYNSRSGLKALTIQEQFSFNNTNQRNNKLLESAMWRGVSGKLSTSITFAKPSYIPFLRMPVSNTAWTARLQVGAGSFGLASDVEAEVYGQKSEVADKDVKQSKGMVGYMYYQNAENHPDYVMDFTRFNDREVTPNTPVISVPQYSYDVFAIQGEGTGGNIRLYRTDLGYVRDNITTSKDKNLSIGGDVDAPGHYGANWTTVKTPSTISEWRNGNKLRGITGFSSKSGYSVAYFRNPGETTVSWDGRYGNIGGTKLVRYELGGSVQSPTIEPKLELFNNDATPDGTSVDLSQRYYVNTGSNNRTQVISFLKAHEAGEVGLDKLIKNYNNETFLKSGSNDLDFEPISREGGYRLSHHISEIDVTESDGKRYVYGIPVYNTIQKDFSFSVDNSYTEIPDQVKYDNDEVTMGSHLFKDNAVNDGYVQITTTPAYAHSFLLSGVLSTNYVDVTGDGITEDDLGDAVKFNYSKIRDGAETVYKWRSPHADANTGNFNAGLRSEVKDDKAMVSYGERESWYLQSVESKNMIALFFVTNRLDGKGAIDETGGFSSSNMLKALDRIALYSKADLKKNGLNNAKAIKTVHFDYSYELCQRTPGNTSGIAGSEGKLTLTGIYFTYNGTNRAKKNKYNFTYSVTSTDNPGYTVAATDRWGGYKQPAQNPEGMKNSDYPYSLQDKTTSNNNAGAWLLKKIGLPSGGEIEVTYESDDYAYVQNKKAAVMMKVAGFGITPSYRSATNKLYPFIYPSNLENDYVFIQVPEACNNAADVYKKYLQGLTQLAFKIWVQMPKGPEYIPCYASFGDIEGVDYGKDANNSNVIWVKMKRLGGKSPLSMTTLEYLRQQLPGQAFKGYDVKGEPALNLVADMLLGMLYSLRDAFSDPVNAFRKDGKAQVTYLPKCFVRLNVPDGYKYGGGHRVKSVVLHDNWNKMTGQYTSSYGQQYNYTTTENYNDSVRTISSGVASYEPSIGGEENPWQNIIQIEDNLPLGPASFGAVEMPVLDAFFPAPGIGYSKVTVTSINTGTTQKKSRSGIGKQVTEFYTAKDYPVYYNYTPFDATSVKQFHQNSTSNFFNKYGYDYKAQSQGFLVATNDMHGKLRSQSSYAENDPDTRIGYTENFYRNTGVNGMDEKFTFVNSYENYVSTGNMGIDIELMTDTREFSVKGTSRDHQAQVDLFFFPLIIIPIPTYWQLNGVTENIYRAVTTTKVINYHAVLDSVVVIDKGSQVSTKNLAYDEETGQVIITQVNNEFNRPVYNITFPAYWAYSGMAPACRNIDATYLDVDFNSGRIVRNPGATFESGDELYITWPGSDAACMESSSDSIKKIWVLDINKNNSSITSSTPDFIFIDSEGRPYNRKGVQFRIVRSGHRNMLQQSIETITSMENPLTTGLMSFDGATKVINASAVEYKEKWQIDNGHFKRYREVFDPSICSNYVEEDPAGDLQKNINPYCNGLLGNFRPWRNMLFYDGRQEDDLTVKTNIAENGFLKAFKPYWLRLSGYMLPDVDNKQWVWNSKLNRVNDKSLELETMDPLGIYTSAQYGYNKTIPVAIANNAQYNEMFAEGFEDYGYGESLNNAQFSSYSQRHIDFNNLAGSNLVNTDNAGFKAHSGKYVLGVNKNATVTKVIPVQSNTGYDFSMPYQTATTKVLGNRGGTFSIDEKEPSDNGTYGYTSSIYDLGNDFKLDYEKNATASNPLWFARSFNAEQYFEIKQAGTYYFVTYSIYDNSGGYYSSDGGSIEITINDVNRNYRVKSFLLTSVKSGSQYTARYSVCLQPGIYLLNSTYRFSGYYHCDSKVDACVIGYRGSTQFEDRSLISYKDVTTQNGCTYTVPAPATDVMQNPIFSVHPNKNMLLSAWVRETCGDATNGIPCKEYTYRSSQVQVKFPGHPDWDVILFPSGPIIDGWQRVEGSFLTPPDASSMTLNLVNSSADTIYFDDIRVHPYNANMKSYVYDPVNLRLTAELDPNNFGSFYEYDEEGSLIRTKVETKEGIKTVTETRSAVQKVIR